MTRKLNYVYMLILALLSILASGAISVAFKWAFVGAPDNVPPLPADGFSFRAIGLLLLALLICIGCSFLVERMHLQWGRHLLLFCLFTSLGMAGKFVEGMIGLTLGVILAILLQRWIFNLGVKWKLVPPAPLEKF